MKDKYDEIATMFFAAGLQRLGCLLPLQPCAGPSTQPVLYKWSLRVAVAVASTEHDDNKDDNDLDVDDYNDGLVQ